MYQVTFKGKKMDCYSDADVQKFLSSVARQIARLKPMNDKEPPHVTGTKKHSLAHKQGTKLQIKLRLFPQLLFEMQFDSNGLRGRLDVIDLGNAKIYDYKCGKAKMSKEQYRLYAAAFSGCRIYTIDSDGIVEEVYFPPN